ncbi:papilin-like [Cheilinus undulatus]|uniref:papilin-like n=1 Tax=Cheilinus undulatus TaxID=241271 RepID=UPI001BD44CBC|nr:papilin-like [Cheilinus undulatus]
MDETEACHLKKAPGGCNSLYLRYYYDAVYNKCKKFFWTGCYGNGNRFPDHETCNATCAGTHDFCRLPQDEGTGHSFIFSVSYDAANDRCIPFLYKGEGGNANRFTNERECIRNCSVNSEKLYPMDETEACHFKKAEGGCSGQYLRYYYDAVHDKCEKFLWTGCFGNGNRFPDHESCKATCASTPDFCRLPQDEGSGNQFIFSVYYDATNDRCIPFLYKGEGGNANRFTNERECIRNCSANSEKLYPMDETEACHLKKAPGGCNGQYLRYYYDAVYNKCKKFLWTGCDGNGNRFPDHETCNATCAGTHDFCRLPQDEGTGHSFIFSVSYDAANDRCIPFLYKGEGGNANRFTNERECIRNCSVNSEKLYPMDETEACHFKKAEGGCSGQYLRYYYDAVHDKCEKFLWTGCFGNGNRFPDHESCKATCASTPDFCQLPQDEGTGHSFILSVSYDAANDRCIPFFYKGEGGNANRFTNERECIRNCSVNSEKLYPMDATEACHFKKAEGGCSGQYLRYYYNAVREKCKKFLWTGCFGNGNRFPDYRTCKATCAGTPGGGDDSDTLDGL